MRLVHCRLGNDFYFSEAELYLSAVDFLAVLFKIYGKRIEIRVFTLP